MKKNLGITCLAITIASVIFFGLTLANAAQEREEGKTPQQGRQAMNKETHFLVGKLEHTASNEEGLHASQALSAYPSVTRDKLMVDAFGSNIQKLDLPDLKLIAASLSTPMIPKARKLLLDFGKIALQKKDYDLWAIVAMSSTGSQSAASLPELEQMAKGNPQALSMLDDAAENNHATWTKRTGGAWTRGKFAAPK